MPVQPPNVANSPVSTTQPLAPKPTALSSPAVEPTRVVPMSSQTAATPISLTAVNQIQSSVSNVIFSPTSSAPPHAAATEASKAIPSSPTITSLSPALVTNISTSGSQTELGKQSTEPAVAAAIALSAIALLLVSLILIKFCSSYRRKRKCDQPSPEDVFFPLGSSASGPDPRHQDTGGVGASPTRSSYSPRNSLNYPIDGISYLNHGQSNQYMVEHIQFGHNSHIESKGWDGSRPSLSLM